MPAETADEILRAAAAFGVVAAAAVPAAVMARFFPKPPRAGSGVRGWTGFDLVFLAIAYSALPGLAVILVDRVEPAVAVPPDAVAAVVGGPADVGVRVVQFRRIAFTGLLVAAAFGGGFLAVVRRPGRVVRIPADVSVGVAVWLVLTPAVFVVHFLANAAFEWAGGVPVPHPLTKVPFLASPLLTALFFASACVVAPLTEELAFRRVAVPWAMGRTYRPWILACVAAAAVVLRGGEVTAGPVGFAVAAAVVLFAAQNGRRLFRRFPTRAATAAVSTAALFAAMHAAVWPSPVPLFVLGIGLGLLVAVRRGAGAAVVVHSLFNAVSAVVLLRGPG